MENHDLWVAPSYGDRGGQVAIARRKEDASSVLDHPLHHRLGFGALGHVFLTEDPMVGEGAGDGLAALPGGLVVAEVVAGSDEDEPDLHVLEAVLGAVGRRMAATGGTQGQHEDDASERRRNLHCPSRTPPSPRFVSR